MCWRRDREGVAARRKGREEIKPDGTSAWVTYAAGIIAETHDTVLQRRTTNFVFVKLEGLLTSARGVGGEIVTVKLHAT